jgi:hypothetical protein
MTEVCKFQSVCDDFEGKTKSASVNATAWIVNWIVLSVLFIGLIMLGNEIRWNTQMRHEQIEVLAKLNGEQDAHLKRLAAALEVSPKHVLPHVVKIEKMLEGKCGGVASIKHP